MKRFLVAVQAPVSLAPEARAVIDVLEPYYEVSRLQKFSVDSAAMRTARCLVVIGELPERLRAIAWSELGAPPPVWITLGSPSAGHLQERELPDVTVLPLRLHERVPGYAAARAIDDLLHRCRRAAEIGPVLRAREPLRELVANLCGPVHRWTLAGAAADIGLKARPLKVRWENLVAEIPGVPEYKTIKSGRRALAVIRAMVLDPKMRFVPAAKATGVDTGTARHDLVERTGKNPNELTLADLLEAIAGVEEKAFGWLLPGPKRRDRPARR